MPNRRSVLTALGAGVAASAFERPARALVEARRSSELIAVLGTGHFGRAMGTRLAAVGHTVIYGSRTPNSERVKALVRDSGPRATAASDRDAASRARVIVFAVPWAPVPQMLPELGDLSGKLIIDPMIARPRFVDKYPFPPDPSTSVAETLQSWIPRTPVVAAFSTISYLNLANSGLAGGPISIPLAGNDSHAKVRVARLTAQLGLDPIDIGAVIAARYMEYLVWMEIAYNVKQYHPGKDCEIYFRLVPQRSPMRPPDFGGRSGRSRLQGDFWHDH